MAKNNASRKITTADTARVLRTVRKHLKLTQVYVSKKMGISQGSLSKMETAKAEPSAIQWLEFCRMTGVPADSLLRENLNLASLKPASRQSARSSRK